MTESGSARAVIGPQRWDAADGGGFVDILAAGASMDVTVAS